MVSFLCLLFLISVISQQLNALSQTAQFRENNTGVDGTVIVSNGWVSVFLDLSNINAELLPDNEECYEQGLLFSFSILVIY